MYNINIKKQQWGEKKHGYWRSERYLQEMWRGIYCQKKNSTKEQKHVNLKKNIRIFTMNARNVTAKEEEPIIAILKISKIEEDFPITIFLTGETYSVKEKLKELGYKWDRDIRAWKKYLLLESVEQEIVILKEIKRIKMSGRPPKKSEYNNWLAAHRGCEQK